MKPKQYATKEHEFLMQNDTTLLVEYFNKKMVSTIREKKFLNSLNFSELMDIIEHISVIGSRSPFNNRDTIALSNKIFVEMKYQIREELYCEQFYQFDATEDLKQFIDSRKLTK